MRVTIIGAGYVGLVTGAGLAKHGNEVTLVDIDEQRVGMINQAKPPFYEEGLESLLQNSAGRNLRATSDINEAIIGADVIFLCVQTSCQGDGFIDLANVKQAATDIGKALNGRGGHPLIVVKSTVVPGTTEKVVSPLLDGNSGKRLGRDFGLAVNPEFLKEGRAVEDILYPDRIVIGELNKESGDVLCELYRDLDAPILRVDLKTAEMIKYASNAFLATKISFINEIGNICKRLGIDVYRVAEGMSLDPRISPHFLNAGIGFGGSCLPKDVKALAVAAKELGYQPSLLESIIKVNEEQPLKLVELAEKRVEDLDRRKTAVLGLAFKPGTDDIREAPSLKIIAELLRRGASVKVYDPVAMEKVRRIFADKLDYAASAEEAVSEAEMVFIVTEWSEFKNPNLYRGKKVFDGRRVLSHDEAEELHYEGICW